jgi:hypothetical protein
MPGGVGCLLLSELDHILDLKRWQNTHFVSMVDREIYDLVTTSHKLIEVIDSVTPVPTNPVTRRDLFRI